MNGAALVARTEQILAAHPILLLGRLAAAGPRVQPLEDGGSSSACPPKRTPISLVTIGDVHLKSHTIGHFSSDARIDTEIDN